MRVNIGCGHLPIEGYTNVDMHAPEADILGDARHLDFQDVTELVSYHFLEHLGWQDAGEFLRRAHGWMAPSGKLVLEVPDMAEILRRGLDDANWWAYIYGSQEHEGEYHRSGYTPDRLRWALEQTGWKVESVTPFLSQEAWRAGMPCVVAVAHA